MSFTAFFFVLEHRDTQIKYSQSMPDFSDPAKLHKWM